MATVGDQATKRTPAEQEALYKAFARAYMDVAAPTYQNASESYRAVVDPNPPEFAAKKAPYRYLNHRVTKTEMARIKTENVAIATVWTGMSLAEYAQECYKMAMLFKERGMIGDSTAAAQMMKTLGQTLGYTEPKTQPLPSKPLTPEEMVVALERKLEVYKRLTAPENRESVPEAEYTIEEETNGNTTEGTEKHP